MTYRFLITLRNTDNPEKKLYLHFDGISKYTMKTELLRSVTFKTKKHAKKFNSKFLHNSGTIEKFTISHENIIKLNNF
jgi:hypothetical protein